VKEEIYQGNLGETGELLIVRLLRRSKLQPRFSGQLSILGDVFERTTGAMRNRWGKREKNGGGRRQKAF